MQVIGDLPRLRFEPRDLRSYLIDSLWGTHMDDGRSVTIGNVAEYAERARIDPDRFDPGEQAVAIDTQNDLVSRLDDLDTPTTPDREYLDPDADDDPSVAFLSRCDLQRTEEGVLSGLSGAVKDNTVVRGVPMTCGSPLCEDHVPAEDATTVDRILRVGGRMVDESVRNGDAAPSGGATRLVVGDLGFPVRRNRIVAASPPSANSSMLAFPMIRPKRPKP